MPPNTTPIDPTIPPTDSAPVDMPTEAPEAPTETQTPVPVNDANLSPNNPPVDQTPAPSENPENQGFPTTQPSVADANTSTDKQTAQMEGNEPIGLSQAPVDEPLPPSSPDASSVVVKIVSDAPATSRARSLSFLAQAGAVIQKRKNMKLEKVMALFEKHSHITNDEVEKLLHVSDATATRYLSILEKQGKILQSGKTGKGVSYSEI